MIIAITGLIGSGKTTVANLLGRRGANVIHVDDIGKWVLEKPAKRAVVRYFGRHMLRRDGRIDVRCLADIVFSSRKHLRKLHELTHPYIRRIIRKRIKPGKVNVIDAALYREFDLHKLSDYTVLVKCSLPKKITRLRSVHSKADILRRLRAQTFVKNPDFVIDNSGSFENLEEQVAEVWNRVCAKA